MCLPKMGDERQYFVYKTQELGCFELHYERTVMVCGEMIEFKVTVKLSNVTLTIINNSCLPLHDVSRLYMKMLTLDQSANGVHPAHSIAGVSVFMIRFGSNFIMCVTLTTKPPLLV